MSGGIALDTVPTYTESDDPPPDPDRETDAWRGLLAILAVVVVGGVAVALALGWV